MTKRKKHEPLIKEDWDSIPCPTCGGHGVLPKDGTLWRKERKSLGLSQRVVAAAMGVSHAYIGELERGTRRMTADVRQRYTDALVKLSNP